MSNYDSIRAAYEEQLSKQKSEYEKQIAKFQRIVADQKSIIENLNQDLKSQKSADKKQNNNQETERFNQAKAILLQSQIQSLEKQLSDEKIENQNLQQKLDEYKNEINELNSALDEQNVNGAKIKKELLTSLRKVKALKAQYSALEDELNKKNAENVQRDTLIQELKLKSAKDEELIEQLKLLIQNSKENAKSSINDLETPEIKETIDSMEELLGKQADEISNLVSQRSKMVAQFYNIQSILQIIDQNSNSLQNVNTSLKKQLVEKDYEFEQYKETENIKWRQCIDKNLKSLPSSIKVDIDFDKDTKEAMVDKLVTAIYSYQSEQNEILNSQTNESNSKDVIQRHLATITQLRGAIELVKKCAGTQVIQDDDRKAILTQCARIQCFIDTENTNFIQESCPDLFKDDLQPEDVANIFYEFIGQKNANASPFVELRSLFCGILQMNKMLMDQNEQIRSHKQQCEMSYFAEKNQDFVAKSREYERQNFAIATNLRKFTHSDSNNVEDLFTEFVNHIREDIEKTQQTHNFEIKQRDNKISELRKHIQIIEEKHENEKKEFTDKANNMVDDIQSQIDEIKSETKSDIKKMNLALKSKDKEIQDLKEEISKMNDDHEMENNNIKESHESLEKEKEILENELDKINEKLKQTQEENNEEIAELKSTIDQMDKALNSLNDRLEHQVERKKFYKQRLVDLQNQTTTNIDDIRTKNQELTTKYVTAVEDLTRKLNESRKELEESKKSIEEFSPLKKELETKLAKVSASERTLRLKLSAANDAINNLKTEFEDRKSILIQQQKAKVSQMNNEFDSILEKFANVFVHIATLLGREVPKQLTIDEASSLALSALEEKNSSEEAAILNDAINLRKQLKLKPSQTLFVSFSQIGEELNNANKAKENAMKDLRLAEDRANQAEREKQKFMDSSRSNNEWEKWARFLFSSVSRIDPSSINASDAKRGLEDAVLSLAGESQTLRKLEILRYCKSLALKFRGDLNRRGKREKVDSLRPMMICMVFVRRLNGFVPGQNVNCQPPRRFRPLVNSV